jgi:hypothetical protein
MGFGPDRPDPYAGHAWRRGDRIRLTALSDKPGPKTMPGSTGSVLFTDSQGTVHIRWDDHPRTRLCGESGVRPSEGDRIEPEETRS